MVHMYVYVAVFDLRVLIMGSRAACGVKNSEARSLLYTKCPGLTSTPRSEVDQWSYIVLIMDSL